MFVLRSGVGWERLPREVCGCTGMTGWRRLRDWHGEGLPATGPRAGPNGRHIHWALTSLACPLTCLNQIRRLC